LKPTTFVRVQKLVYEQTAIVLEDGKEYLVESRLAPLARAQGFLSVDDLCQRLGTRSDLAAQVVDAMTTNETSFFRDHHPFEAIRQHVLPTLIARRLRERSLRIWCAACSSGQEPYSMAMLIAEKFPELAGWNVRIDATDVSRTVIARARLGRYTQVEVNRGLTPALLDKYFSAHGTDWEIRPEIGRLVRFSELNLIAPWPTLEVYDLIFLRNVLIYFDLKTKLAVLTKVRQQAAQDGFLVLGGSESTPRELRSFERLPIARAGVYRVKSLRPSLSQAR
jgi:chemotaxis protein methyltransferase CheR